MTAENESALITRQEQLISAQQAQLAALGQHVMQLGSMIVLLEQRMKAMEKSQAAATLSHAQVLAVQRRVRRRAAELCAKYRIGGQAAMRAAIHRDILSAQGVKNLHDAPLRALADIEKQIDTFVGYEQAVAIRRKESSACSPSA